jgi:PAS domain S-box-containing protein
MTVEIWEVGWNSQIDLPFRPLGYVIFAVYVIFLVAAHYPRRKPRKTQISVQHRNLLIALLIISAIFSNMLVLRWADASSPIPPEAGLFGNPGLLSSVAWMLAGGFLGIWQAGLVALVSGLSLAFFGSGNLLSPVSNALLATLITWLIRNHYRGRIGRGLRRPIVSAILGGIIFSLPGILEFYSYTQGDVVQSLNAIESSFWVNIFLSLLPLIVAGIVSGIAKARTPRNWFQPHRLTPLPYEKTLTGKFLSMIVVFGSTGGVILLFAVWIAARTFVQDLFESQTIQSARTTAQSIPYFIQTGRALSGRYAIEVSDFMEDHSALEDELRNRETMVAYFSGFAVFDLNQSQIAGVSDTERPGDLTAQDLDTAIHVALSGVPNEVVIGPKPGSITARVVFLTPVYSKTEGNLTGVLSAWTELGTNPFLLPTMDRIRDGSPGRISIVDNRGRVVMSSSASNILDPVELDALIEGFQESELEGETSFSHLHIIEGYPWYVVSSYPRSDLNRMAISLSFGLFQVSKQLTRPLEDMVEVAESIAKGNLEKSIPKEGEDEIGRLAGSFERMRASMHSKISEMDLLLAVSQRVASSLDLTKFLPPILDGVRGLTNADLVRIIVAPDSGTSEGELEGYHVGHAPGGWTSLDGQVLELCRERGHFILENPNRARALLDLDEIREKLSSLVAFPILNEDDFVGCLWIGHRDPFDYTNNETNIISIISGHLGVAVTNARLYHQGEEERSNLNLILQAIPDAVIVTDSEGVITMANQAAEFALTTTSEQARGQHAEEVVGIREILDLLANDSHQAMTTELTLKGGRSYFVSVTDQKNRRSGKICVLWDVTHFRELDFLKSAFVSSVSHDLRVPLTLMNGYVTMLSRVGSLNDQQKEYIRKITSASDQMTHLVDNVLDLGRIEGGRPIKYEEFDIESLVQDVLDSYHPQALNKRIKLNTEIQSGMVKVSADPMLLRQAIANLIDNAIQFSNSEDKIVVRAHQQGDRQFIQIQDEGIGIAPTDQARLFEKFFGVESQKSTGPGPTGSGLGLSIVKSIIDQHAGLISVESRLGEGSIFTVEIPVKQPFGE